MTSEKYRLLVALEHLKARALEAAETPEESEEIMKSNSELLALINK